MRVIGKLSPLKNATSTSGSLQTLASLTILPLASTMHTLDSSRDTSIPACCSIAILHLDARGRISIGPLSILLGDSYLTACSEQGPLRHLFPWRGTCPRRDCGRRAHARGPRTRNEATGSRDSGRNPRGYRAARLSPRPRARAAIPVQHVDGETRSRDAGIA